MASGIAPPSPKPADSRSQRDSAEYGHYVDKRLRQTRWQVKNADIWAGLITLAIGVLAYLLATALVDHWLIPAGLGFWGRLVFFAGLAVVAGVYLVLYLVPLVLHRINPIFAAHTIEQGRPSLKNGLVNLLYLRRERTEIDQDPLAKGIYEALEQKAAADLTQISPDTAVDRSHVIRLGYLLAAILAACCLYLALSPKSTWVSVRRIIWPWADIKAPTRVTIENVQPGDDVAYQGDIVTISAEVDGLDADEPVMLYYTTADGLSVDQAVPLILPEGRYRHYCDLPPGSSGLQQDLQYYLAAGDCRTRRFQIEVQTALSIVVDRVEYDYPEYTGLADRVDRRVGDLRAIEGTQVTIRATTNQEIGRAAVEMDCDPRYALPMRVEDSQTASARLTLAMSRDDSTRPEHDSYQLRFTDPGGRENHRPVRHRIEVIPDRVPKIDFVDPPPEEVKLPEDGMLELQVRAEDPDFGLRQVTLGAERDEQSLPVSPLLAKARPEPAHDGPFQGAYRFEPARLGLKAGDRVIYWGEAQDNKEPVANRAETARRWIIVVPPEGRQPPEEEADGTAKSGRPRGQDQQDRPPQQPDEPQQDQEVEPEEDPQAEASEQEPGPAEKSQEGQPGQSEQPDQEPTGQDQPGDEGQASDSATGGGSKQQPGEKVDQKGSEQEGSGQQQGDQGSEAAKPDRGGPSASPDAGRRSDQPSGGPSESPPEPIDGTTNPGDAFEKILNHLDEQRAPEESQQPGEPQQQPGEPQQQPGERQPGEPQPAEPTPAQPTPAEKQGTGAGQPDGQGPKGAAPSQPEPPQPQRAPKAQPQSGAEQPDAGKPGQPTQGEQPLGDQQPSAKPQPGRQDQPPIDQQPPEGGTQASGSEQGDRQRGPEDKPAGDEGAGSDQELGDGQGPQAKGPGKPTPEQPPGPGREKPEAGGGEPQESKETGGAGKPSPEDAGTTSPQHLNQERKKQGGRDDQSEPGEKQEAESPSISPKDSDSKSDTEGDRSGGGKKGGGQKTPQQGVGTPGSHTPSEQGASQSDQQGEGETGAGPGDQVKADQPTGRSADEQEGPGSGQRKQPGGQQPGQQPQAAPEASPSGDRGDAGQPGTSPPQGQDPSQQGTPGAGNPIAGGKPGARPPGAPSAEPGIYRGDDPNLEYTRKRTNLALEYLEDQLAKEQPDEGLLGRLGWNKEDLQRFYQEWDQLRREAAGQGPGAEAARRNLDKALRSLGLRPPGTQLRGGQTKAERVGSLKEGFRSKPPDEWAEPYRAYRMGLDHGDE